MADMDDLKREGSRRARALGHSMPPFKNAGKQSAISRCSYCTRGVFVSNLHNKEIIEGTATQVACPFQHDRRN